jgi:hypothetical protein
MTSQCLLVITWDENEGGGDNRVATILAAEGVVPPGFQSQAAYNHYSLLRTVEAAWDLAPLTANDAQAAVMADFFPASPPGGG